MSIMRDRRSFGARVHVERRGSVGFTACVCSGFLDSSVFRGVARAVAGACGARIDAKRNLHTHTGHVARCKYVLRVCESCAVRVRACVGKNLTPEVLFSSLCRPLVSRQPFFVATTRAAQCLA